MVKSLDELLIVHPIIHRSLLFFKLPNCFLEIIKKKECKKSRLRIAYDLLELFFLYKTFPVHYGIYRLWEVEKSQWKYYYGSHLQPYPRLTLRNTVQPPEYDILFRDKEVCELLCKGIGVSIPYTYGLISPDQNYKERIDSWFQNIDEDSLIIKPLKGNAARGIVLAKRINKKIIIQSKTGITPLSEFKLSDAAIVQRIIKQDRRMSAFSPASLNTIRVVTMYTKNESIIVLATLMRCGIGDAFVDNWSAGGIAVGIDKETGHLNKHGFDKEGSRYTEHPTSKVMFEGFRVPEWQGIINLATKIQRAFPCYRILGTDIALQENGEPVLIEINGTPGFHLLEAACGPLLRDEQNLKAFGEYNLLVNKFQRELYSLIGIPQL
jgi:hypothetical protein